MSFSSDVKTELSRRLLDGADCCTLSAVYGALLYCSRCGKDGIKLTTENKAFADSLNALFPVLFRIKPDSAVQMRSGKYTITISDPEKTRLIFDKFGYDPDHEPALHFNRAVLECEHCAEAFLRGAFLAGGSVTDPEKRYHLELLTGHYYVDREVYALMLELNLRPKSAKRGGNNMLYLKASSEIEDALTLIGAPISAMKVMTAKVEKGLRGGVSRLVNCDTANAEKTANASVDQLIAIRKLQSSGKLSSLSDRLQEAAALRLENPEISLAELAKLSGVSKSGLAHRLKKIIEIASC
ncbi:MAG: DNA-binding protein WhiA [Oscillospiraceae bacterium]|jgi:DNA-binding protein WhiA|nr:DNA-binding protein WhiA [Oscillospiraceae bacterium]